jgi:hypothetical protein
MRVVTHECPSELGRCGLRRSHRSRTEGHPLDATLSRTLADLGAVRRPQPGVVRRADPGVGAGCPGGPARAAGAALGARGERGHQAARGGAGDGRWRGLHFGSGPVAPRRDAPSVRRGPGPLDAGHVAAQLHLRTRPSARRGRGAAAARTRAVGTAAARRRPARLPRPRRHGPRDPRLCQAGRRARVHRGQRPGRAAGDPVHAPVGAGDRRLPAAPRRGELDARCPETARRRPGHSQTSRGQRAAGGTSGLSVLRPHGDRCRWPGRGPILGHVAPHPERAGRDRRHRRGRVDPDRVPARGVGRRGRPVGLRRRGRRDRVHRVHRAPPGRACHRPG